MYICVCNGLTDGDICRAAIDRGARRPLDVFSACRCRVQCGTCVRKVLELLRQAGIAGDACALDAGALNAVTLVSGVRITSHDNSSQEIIANVA